MVLKHWHYFLNNCPQTILQLVLALGKTGTMGELASLSYYIFKQHLKIHKSFPFTHHNRPLLYFFFFLTLSCWSLELTLAPETKGRTLMIRHWPIDKKKYPECQCLNTSPKETRLFPSWKRPWPHEGHTWLPLQFVGMNFLKYLHWSWFCNNWISFHFHGYEDLPQVTSCKGLENKLM